MSTYCFLMFAYKNNIIVILLNENVIIFKIIIVAEYPLIKTNGW